MSSSPFNAIALIVLGSLMAFTSLSVDIYLPALPAMQHDLGPGVTLTITTFLIGFACAQLFWGPFSDRFGRKLPLYLGMFIFVLGSIGCAWSTSLNQLLLWRALQATGACTAPMLARAMIRDVYGLQESARILSMLTLVMSLAPIIGPLLGGQVLKFYGWHTIFMVLALLGSSMALALRLLPETLPITQRRQDSFSSAFGGYKRLITNLQFMRYSLCIASYYIGVYAFLVASPYVYMQDYHMTPTTYSWVFGLNILGLMIGSLINHQLVLRFALPRLVQCASAGAVFAAVWLCYHIIQHAELWIIASSVVIFMSMSGILVSCSISLALESVASIAGSASAVLGALQYGSGILSTILLSYVTNHHGLTMALLMLCAAIGSLVMASIHLNTQP